MDMTNEFSKYVLAKTASKVFGEAKAFFDELASATRKSPVYINGKAVGFIYTTKNGELKGVSMEEIAAEAKRLGTSILISRQVTKKL